jgi:hypothetical protein
MHGQGIIIWDITGCGRTSATQVQSETYLGDPRFLDPKGSGLTVQSPSSPYVPPTSPLGLYGIEPAMNAIADQIFASIRSAGLQCGLCLRAEKVYIDSTGNMEGSLFPDNEQVYDTVANQLADLDAKLNYAYKRWGCRMFYVDSNESSADVGPAEAAQLNPRWAAAYVYTQLNLRHPDCVIIPEEHYNAAFSLPSLGINDPAYQYERVASRYTALWFPWQGPFLTSLEVAAVPDAFTFINTTNMGSSDTADTANVVYAIQHGKAILMANVWWSDVSVTLVNGWQTTAGVNGF